MEKINGNASLRTSLEIPGVSVSTSVDNLPLIKSGKLESSFSSSRIRSSYSSSSIVGKSFFEVVPSAKTGDTANGEVKVELDKAYQMIRNLRKENEEYQKDALKEKDKTMQKELKLKEKESYVIHLEEEKAQMRSEILRLEEKLKNSEVILVEERRAGAAKLEEVLAKQKALEAELNTTLSNTAHISKQLNVLINRVAFSAVSQISNQCSTCRTSPEKIDDAPISEIEEIHAPLGRVAFVFTDVEGSTEKWEKSPEIMQECLFLHNEAIRAKLKQHKGYEVKTEGDSFLTAFGNPVDALNFAIDVQLALLQVHWPEDSLRWPSCKPEKNKTGTQLIWGGLRVRAGIHYGIPTYNIDPTTGRMDYLGPVLNKASRVSHMASGGQILVSTEFWDEVRMKFVNREVDVKDLGTFKLKGLAEETALKQILPTSLAERLFSPSITNYHSNSLEQHLKALLTENEKLQSRLAEIDKDINSIVQLSHGLEQKFSNSPQNPSQSSHSIYEILQSAVWKDTVNKNLQKLQDKIDGYHKDSEHIRGKISVFVAQKLDFTEEKESMLNRVLALEREKERLVSQIVILKAKISTLEAVKEDKPAPQEESKPIRKTPPPKVQKDLFKRPKSRSSRIVVRSVSRIDGEERRARNSDSTRELKPVATKVMAFEL